MTLLTPVLSTLLTFTLPITAQQSPNNGSPLTFPSTFEMDLLFPQNTTYKLPPSDIFPIVFAIQNVSSLYRAISAFEKAQNLTPGHLYPHISWHVDAYRDNGRLPGYAALEMGQINLTDSTYRPAPKEEEEEEEEEGGDDYAIYTAIVNMTAVLEKDYGKVTRPDFRYVVTYYVQIWGEYFWASNAGDENCPGPEKYGSSWITPGLGRVIFNIDRPQLDDYLPPDQLAEAKKAQEVDVMKSIPECPELVSFVDILPNITDLETGGLDKECPVYFDGKERQSERANPCALKVDGQILSAVLSEVSRLATPTTTTAEEVFTSTSTGAAGLATAHGLVRPMQTALAAACVLCGLAL